MGDIKTAKTESAKSQRIETVKLLVASGCNLNLTDESGMTALHWAAFNDDTDVIEFLLSKDA